MRFLVDAQLPPALARRLVLHGHVAEHVMDRNLQSAPDSEIWALAVSEDAAIVTKDEDFAQRRIRTASGPVVIWIRLPNTRSATLLTWLDALLPEVVIAMQRGETLIELL